jgi:hypothetical protein
MPNAGAEGMPYGTTRNRRDIRPSEALGALVAMCWLGTSHEAAQHRAHSPATAFVQHSTFLQRETLKVRGSICRVPGKQCAVAMSAKFSEDTADTRARPGSRAYLEQQRARRPGRSENTGNSGTNTPVASAREHVPNILFSRVGALQQHTNAGASLISDSADEPLLDIDNINLDIAEKERDKKERARGDAQLAGSLTLEPSVGSTTGRIGSTTDLVKLVPLRTDMLDESYAQSSEFTESSEEVVHLMDLDRSEDALSNFQQLSAMHQASIGEAILGSKRLWASAQIMQDPKLAEEQMEGKALLGSRRLAAISHILWQGVDAVGGAAGAVGEAVGGAAGAVGEAMGGAAGAVGEAMGGAAGAVGEVVGGAGAART